MVKISYPKPCCPELKFCLNEGLDVMQKTGQSAWKNAPLFLNLQCPILTKPTATLSHEM